MANFTQFDAADPVIIPPIEEKVYNKYWLSKLVILAPTTNSKAELYAEFIPCRDIVYSDNLVIKEGKSPLVDGDTKVIKIDDLFTLAFANPGFAMAMEMVFRALKAYGEQTGLFVTPVEETTTTTTIEETTTTTTEVPIEETTTTTTTIEETTTTTTAEEVAETTETTTTNI